MQEIRATCLKNAEYDAAKEAQGLLEMRIAKLEEVHANARLIDESQLDVSKVSCFFERKD
jgi:transcription elongation factor GreA